MANSLKKCDKSCCGQRHVYICDVFEFWQILVLASNLFLVLLWVLLKNVLDYSIVFGSSLKIIKGFDFESRNWEMT